MFGQASIKSVLDMSNPFQTKPPVVVQINKHLRESGNLFMNNSDRQSGFGKSVMDPRSIMAAPIMPSNQLLVSTQRSAKETALMRQILGTFYNCSYLLTMHTELRKKGSMDVALKSTKEDSDSSKPRDNWAVQYVKLPRLKFNKIQTTHYQDGLDFSSRNVVLRYNVTQKAILIKQLTDSLDLTTCHTVAINFECSLAPSIEYDRIFGRVFVFDNLKSQVIVLSQKHNERLCQVQLVCKRTNPKLILHQVQQKRLLIVIGGYEKHPTRNEVSGSKYVEIFEFGKWHISLQPKCIKLVLGRIAPIVFIRQLFQLEELIILGGNTAGRIDKGQLKTQDQHDLNYSVNLTGATINCQQLTDALNGQSVTIFNSLNIQMIEPTKLHSGFLLQGHNQIRISLTKGQKLFQLKNVGRRINISTVDEFIFCDADDSCNIGVRRGIKSDQQHFYFFDKRGRLAELKFHLKNSLTGEGCAIF